jgi:adenylate kinase
MAEKEESETEHPPILQSKRVFINCVDSYQGRNIAKYLAQCVVGATEDEDEGVEEEQDEQKDSDEEQEEKQFEKKPGTYEIVGTLGNAKTQQKLDFVQQIIKYETKDELYAELMQCDVIIYDIMEDAAQIEEAVWAVSQLHSDIEKIEKKKPKMFILISTVLTWAQSKLNPEDPELPFTEDDYRRRRPHADFKEHISAEKHVTKLGKTSKSKLGTYVIASGLTYGAGENIFHYLFKTAWHNAQELTCYGKGNNVLPTIHIQDLAAVVQNIMDSKPKVRYIVAVDD